MWRTLTTLFGLALKRVATASTVKRWAWSAGADTGSTYGRGLPWRVGAVISSRELFLVIGTMRGHTAGGREMGALTGARRMQHGKFVLLFFIYFFQFQTTIVSALGNFRR